MAERCVKVGCPEVLRLALQDPCTGEPIPGVGNGMVLRCTRNVTLEKVIRDPEISEFVSDCNIVDRYVQDAQLQGFNLSFEVASLSPQLEALLNGDLLLADTGTNVGVLYEALQGCSQGSADPRFIAELFYQVRQCDSSGAASYVRYVVSGLRFQPSEMDKEGQIGIARFSGTSDPTLANGITSINDGPYADLPAAIVTDINALPAGTSTFGFWFVDDTDPTAGVTLDANTCYAADVPVAAP